MNRAGKVPALNVCREAQLRGPQLTCICGSQVPALGRESWQVRCQLVECVILVIVSGSQVPALDRRSGQVILS